MKHRAALAGLALVALVLACDLAAAAPKQAKLPSKWKICKKNDPHLQECFRSAVELAVKDLVNGNQNIGVLPIDPLRLTELNIDQGVGPVSIDLQFRNLDMKGIRNLRITGGSIDPKTYEMTAEVQIDSPLYLEGDYTIKGRVLVLPINGNGRCNLTLEHPTLSLKQMGKIVNKGGEDYYEPTVFMFNIDTKKLHLYFENLFNGNKQLADTMNTFLNENSGDILKELKPAISDGFGEAFRQISNRVFSKVPINKIFPEK